MLSPIEGSSAKRLIKGRRVLRQSSIKKRIRKTYLDDSDAEVEAPRKRQQLCDTSEKLCELDVVRRKLDFDAEPLFELPTMFVPSLAVPSGNSRNPFMRLLDSTSPLPTFQHSSKDHEPCPTA